MEAIDLSGEIYDGQPGHMEARVAEHRTFAETASRFEPPCHGFVTRALTFSDHASTHVDAPAHFYPDGTTIDRMPVGGFCGPGVVVDLGGETGQGGELPLDVLRRTLELSEAKLSGGDVVLFRFGTGDVRWGGLSADVTDLLIDRGVRLVGTDQGSIDWSGNKDRPAHVRLLQEGIPIVEGLRNLERVAGRRFLFLGLPLRIREATGSPIRAVALLDPGGLAE